MKKADFIREPELIIRHTGDRVFIGPDAVAMGGDEVWLLPHWGGEPANFDSLNRPVFLDPMTGNIPTVMKSADGGKSWDEQRFLHVRWDLAGHRSNGGLSVLRLHSGRMMMISHVSANQFSATGNHGVPAQSFSDDGGAAWSDFEPLHPREDAIYVMNHRLIQMACGRLVLPIHRREPSISHERYAEGVQPTIGQCYLSDDEGKSWRLSRGSFTAETARGVQEPCVAETAPNRLMMMYRSGLGSHQICYSDDGGETWSRSRGTVLTAACSPLTLVGLPGGRFMVLYNHAQPLERESYFPRSPLCCRVSDDGADTWSEPVVIDDSPMRQLIYPTAVPLREGILIIYSSHFTRNRFERLSGEEALAGGGMACMIPYPC